MDSHLVARAKRMLCDGSLPSPERFASYGGPSAGSRCAVCEEPIPRGDLEIEVEWLAESGRARVTMHPRCQGAWHIALAEVMRERPARQVQGEAS